MDVSDRRRYTVLVPDPFYGDSLVMNQIGKIDLQKWLKGEYNAKKTPHTPEIVDVVVAASIKKLREDFGQKVSPRS